MERIYEGITKTVGNTPLVRLNKVSKGLEATVAAKMESFNPLHSVKDRIGLAMIEAAERAGVRSRRIPLLWNLPAEIPASAWPSSAQPRDIGWSWSCPRP